MIRYCPHCWKEIGLETTLCPHCGQPTEEVGIDFVSKLISALRHPEPTRVGLAIDLLADRLHELRAIDPLIELLASTKDLATLKQGARALGTLGDSRAVPALVKLLGNADAPFVARREAAFALGKLGGEEAKSALTQAASDPRPSVANAAREAYQALKSRASP